VAGAGPATAFAGMACSAAFGLFLFYALRVTDMPFVLFLPCAGGVEDFRHGLLYGLLARYFFLRR